MLNEDALSVTQNVQLGARRRRKEEKRERKEQEVILRTDLTEM